MMRTVVITALMPSPRGIKMSPNGRDRKSSGHPQTSPVWNQ
jgi:hypothetical protein